MKFSQSFIPTLKETPAEAEVISHQLMLRAGLIRKLAAGVYTWLPMGYRVLRKVEKIVREEMDRAGSQEIIMPAVQPAGLWQESGRWEHYGKELLRFKDRHDNEYCLAPTHEEVMADLVRHEIRSYRDMPKNMYQVQTKFRDEIRPRFGVMRAREFLMKDAYSFDVDDEASATSYWQMHDAYMLIFQRLGLRFTKVEADSGAIGGSFSHEFMVLAETGEDEIVSCKCGYGSNVEKAKVVLPEAPAAKPGGDTEEVHTPDAHTIEALAEFLKVTPAQTAKTMIYLADGKPVVAMVRGDREVNEIKLKNLIGAADLELAPPAVIADVTGGPVGFSGPVGLDVPIYADQELWLEPALVVGANKGDYHLVNLNMERDVPQATKTDLRNITPSDPCPKCGGKLEFARGIEVGHIFRLGIKYSEPMGATYQDADGNEKPIVMGSYGIGVSRIVAAAIEQGHDENGIIFPIPIAPVAVEVLPMKPKGESVEVAQRLHDELWAKGVDCLLDDRDVRPGVKFKDGELLGIPIRLVVGPKGLEKGEVEVKFRADGKMEMMPLDDAVERIAALVKEAGGQML